MVKRRGGVAEEILVAEDLSATGIFVRCDEPYTVGTALQLQLGMPGGERIEAVGRVVRVGPGASGHTGMGVLFLDLDSRARAAVDRLVSAALATDRGG